MEINMHMGGSSHLSHNVHFWMEIATILSKNSYWRSWIKLSKYLKQIMILCSVITLCVTHFILYAVPHILSYMSGWDYYR